MCTAGDYPAIELCQLPNPNLQSFQLLGEFNIILDISTIPLPQLSPFITNSLLAPGQLGQSLLKLLLHPCHLMFELLPVLLHLSVVCYLVIKAAILLL